MAEQKITDGSLALEQKRHRVITIEAAERPQNIKLRVAAYARVSSASDDQLNSFAAQNRYYTALISGKENWTMVDIYADEGITGTSVEKRDDFKRLLADCRRGKIDRVLVKSISRFARNTKECLEAIRELKSLGVGVHFEKENIDTATMSGEMMTALFASFAQAESDSISGNMRWSYQKRMQNGTFNTCRAPYGYRLENNTLVICEDEAKIVRYIFNQYLSGKHSREIAVSLTESGPDGKKWSHRAVEYILQNERYAGNALLQKRYTTETLPRRQPRNKGELPMYYVEGSNEAIITQDTFDRAQRLRESRVSKHMSERNPQLLSGAVCCGNCGKVLRPKHINGKVYMYLVQDHHEGIVSRETFDAVQTEIARRNAAKSPSKKNAPTGMASYSSKYALSERLVCGECGTLYRRCTWSKKGRKRVVWRCVSRLDYGTKYCHQSPSMDEEALQRSILAAINSAMSQKNELIRQISGAMEMELAPIPGETMTLAEIDHQLDALNKRFQMLLSKAAEDGSEPYTEQFKAIVEETTALKDRKRAIETLRKENAEANHHISMAVATMQNASAELTQWDEPTIRQLVDTVKVISADEIIVYLRGSVEIRQEIIQ